MVLLSLGAQAHILWSPTDWNTSVYLFINSKWAGDLVDGLTLPRVARLTKQLELDASGAIRAIAAHPLIRRKPGAFPRACPGVHMIELQTLWIGLQAVHALAAQFRNHLRPRFLRPFLGARAHGNLPCGP